jgi:hypothetical protein
MRWRWIRAPRCVAPIPFPLCLHYIHAPGRPSLTQPSHTAPAQRRRRLKVKSDAPGAGAVDPVPGQKLKFSYTTARAIQLRRAPSTHASHGRSPSRPDPTSSSGQLHTHPARPLRLKSTHSACSLRLTPDSGPAPATHLYPHQDSSSAV